MGSSRFKHFTASNEQITNKFIECCEGLLLLPRILAYVHLDVSAEDYRT